MEQASAWPPSPSFPQYAHQMPITPTASSSGHMQYPRISTSWPAPLLRRSSSEDARLNQFAGPYYAPEANSSVNSLTSKGYPQRRTSNRDEFDGPSQLLDKPDEAGYEPKEEDLPQLPINLYAQEQDEILSQVNDRLSQCAFDFVARYQFPIPIEPDKRPVRVPSDREWSEVSLYPYFILVHIDCTLTRLLPAVGLSLEEVGNQTSDPISSSVQRSDQATHHHSGEQLGDATCCKASIKTSQGRSEHPAADKLRLAGC